MIELMRATAKEILHNSRLTNDDIDSLCMGKFRIIDNPKGFDYGIRYYIKSIFTLLGGSQDSILRFCTYDEFEHIHRKIYNPSNPIFRYFLIDNEYERRQFCNNYTQDYKGYLTLFQTIGHPLEKLFFSWIDAKVPYSTTHSYIVGSSGSGKSELLKTMIIDKVNRNKSAVILIDPKGDLAEQVAKLYGNSTNDRLIYFDPSLFSNDDFYPILNPFDIPKKDPRAIELATDTIVEVLEIVLTQIDKNSKFTTAMKGILYYTIPVILRLENGNLNDLYRFLNDEKNQDLIELGRKSPNPEHRHFFNGEFQEDSLKVSKNSIRARLRIFLAMKGFSAIMQGKSTIDLYKAIDEKKLIVFNLSKGLMGKSQSKNFGRIVIGLTLIAMIEKAKAIPNPKYRPQVHLFVDEFQNYITQTVSEVLAEARAYGLHLNMATQIVGQAMDNELEKLVLGNTDVKVLGNSGYENRRHFANYFGMKEQDLEVEQYKFWVRVKDGYPFTLTPSKQFLDNKGSMSQTEWKELLRIQKARYYRKYIEPKNQTEAEPQSKQKAKFDL